MTIQSPDPYAVLGLSPQASLQQVRRAYRMLVRQHHPDTTHLAEPSDGATSRERLEQVTAAYETLADPARRAEYDRRTARSPHTHPAPGPAPVWWHGIGERPPIQVGPVRWHDGPFRLATVDDTVPLPD